MLKLERKSQREAISVIFYQYPSLFNKSFLNAFLMALMIHLAGLTLFKIDLVSIRHSETIHAPALLQIDFNVPLQEAVAEVEREDLLKLSLEPRFSVLNYPSAPPPRFTSNLSPSPSNLLLPFPTIPSSLESNLFLEKKTKSQPLLISISGPLAEYATWELDQDGLILLNYLSQTLNPENKHQIYRIKVENNRIYWHENKNGTEWNLLTTLLPYFKFHLRQGFYHLMGDLELNLP